MARPGDRKGARGVVRGVRRRAALAALSRNREADADAAAVAQEVYEACLGMSGGREEDPLPLGIRGPLFAVGVRAVHAIRAQNPAAVRSEDDALDVIAYLTEGWCAMMLSFNREHFEAWRGQRGADDGAAPAGGTTPSDAGSST